MYREFPISFSLGYHGLNVPVASAERRLRSLATSKRASSSKVATASNARKPKRKSHAPVTPAVIEDTSDGSFHRSGHESGDNTDDDRSSSTDSDDDEESSSSSSLSSSPDDDDFEAVREHNIKKNARSLASLGLSKSPCKFPVPYLLSSSD